MWSYFWGKQKKGGWFHYYGVALLLKTPIGYLALLPLALFALLVDKRYRTCWRHEIVLIAPAVYLFILVSTQTGFNHHLRYLVPALPFVYIWASRVGKSFALKHRSIAFGATAAFAIGIVGSLSVFPHSLSYFNQIAGGPVNGKAYLLDSNIDWGQDLFGLRDWQKKHPESDPINARIFGTVDPSWADISLKPIPRDSKLEIEWMADPKTGWYAISVNHLMGYRNAGIVQPCLTCFQILKPSAIVGYSIYIFHVGPEEAKKLKQHFLKTED